MTGDEYRRTLDTVASCGRLLLLLDDDLDQARQTVEHADTVGPVTDPTAYATGGARRLLEQRRVLDAAIGFRDACRAVEPPGSLL